MDLNEKFQEICNECGGVKKMKAAFSLLRLNGLYCYSTPHLAKLTFSSEQI